MENILRKILNYPRLVLITTLLTTVALFWVMKDNSRMETDLDEYMPQDHPAFVYSDQAEEWFGINDGIIIAIENKDGIYNEGTIQKVKDLTKNLQKMDEINKDVVTSLYTADNIIGTEDGMDVKAFFKLAANTKEKLQEMQQKVRDNDKKICRALHCNLWISPYDDCVAVMACVAPAPSDRLA